MLRRAELRPRIWLSAAIALVLAAPELCAQQRVGVNSAVNPDATGTPPGGTARRLVIGQSVVFNERISTGRDGQTQLLFLDESAMSIGPNSDLTIDQFVYDPNAGTGKLAISVTRGVMRFVGGKLSKQEDAVTLRSPTTTIAIRGGVFLFDQQANGQADVVFLFGKQLSVTGSNGVTETLTRPGFGVTVAGAGASPSTPYRVPPQVLAQLQGQLDGRSGGNGGASRVPTNATVASSSVSSTISGDVSASVAQATAQADAQQQVTQPRAVNVNNLQTNLEVNTVQAQGAVASTQPASAPPPPPPPSPVAVSYAGAYKTTPGSGTALGFTSSSPFFNIAYTGGQIGADGFYVANLNGSPIRFPVKAGGGTLNFDTTNTASPFGPISGTSFISSDSTFLYSNNTETSFTDERSFVFGGIPVNSSFYAPTANTRVLAFAVQPDAALQANVPFIRSDAGGNLPNASISPYYIVAQPNQQFGTFNDNTNPNGTSPRTLQASLAVNGQGTGQSSVLTVQTGTFNSTDAGQVYGQGIVRGSFNAAGSSAPVRIGSSVNTVRDGAGNSLFGSNTLTGFVLDQNNQDTSGAVTSALATEAPLGGTTTNYAFTQPAITAALPSGAGAARTSQTLSGFFGGIMTPRGGGGNTPYILSGVTGVQTSATDSRVAAIFAGGDPFTQGTSGIQSMVLAFGEVANRPFGRAAFIDDARFAALESPDVPSQINGTNLPTPQNGAGTPVSPRLAMVTSDTVPSTAVLPAGVSYCQCQYLQWGYWSADVGTPNAQQTALSRLDRAHINTWLAGQPTLQSDLNSLAGLSTIGSFSGHAIGSVNNNGVNYLAAGAFNSTYNFGTMAGTASISNFDGRSVTVPVTGSASGIFVGAFANTSVTAQAVGQFFGPSAANVGGNFAFRALGGTPYLASGIFAGSR